MFDAIWMERSMKCGFFKLSEKNRVGTKICESTILCWVRVPHITAG